MEEYKSGKIKLNFKIEMKTVLAEEMPTRRCVYGKRTCFGFISKHAQSDFSKL